MATIRTLHELVRIVDTRLIYGERLWQLRHLLQQYDGHDWKGYKRLDPTTYTRVSVARGQRCELLLIGWNDHQESPIHDHPDSGCLLRVMEGKVVEQLHSPTDLETPTREVVRSSIESPISYLSGDDLVHRISNPTDDPAYTLHLYSPPGYVCKRWHMCTRPRPPDSKEEEKMKQGSKHNSR